MDEAKRLLPMTEPPGWHGPAPPGYLRDPAQMRFIPKDWHLVEQEVRDGHRKREADLLRQLDECTDEIHKMLETWTPRWRARLMMVAATLLGQLALAGTILALS